MELHVQNFIILITARILRKKNGFSRPVHPSHERESVGFQDRKLEATTFRQIGFANFERDLRVQRRNGRPKTRDVFVRGTPRCLFFVFLSAIRLQNSACFCALLRNAMMMLRFCFERAQTRPRCERSIDPTDMFSRATTKSSKQSTSILKRGG